MRRHRAAKWTRLDNAAKIFPSTSNRRDTKVFRFACELFEPVQPDLLQDALDATIEIFPLYRSVLRKGLFWYYLESSDIKPAVHLEVRRPCGPLYDPVRRSLLFAVTYYRNRINLEVYHALTDGTGALQFLRMLVYQYLIRRHAADFKNGVPIMDYDASATERADDSFRRYYSEAPRPKQKDKAPAAYHMQGPYLPDCRMHVMCGEISVREMIAKAKEHHATLTAFTAALFICAIYGEMPLRERKKPVVLSIPVNLRNYFASESARNFFGVFSVGYQFQDGSGELDDVIKHITQRFSQELTADQLSQRMNELSALEHNSFIRVMPLSLKNVVLRFFNWLSARTETASISNIGKINMPAELEKYIRLFDVFISAGRLQMCMCSFGDRLMVSITSPFVSTDVQKRFFRMISAMGIGITLHTNPLDEEG